MCSHLFYAGTGSCCARGFPPIQMGPSHERRALRDPQQIGIAENLREEGELFGELARASGVNVKVEVYTDMVHVFQNFFQWVPVAQKAVMDLGAYVRAKSWDNNALKGEAVALYLWACVSYHMNLHPHQASLLLEDLYRETSTEKRGAHQKFSSQNSHPRRLSSYARS